METHAGDPDPDPTIEMKKKTDPEPTHKLYQSIILDQGYYNRILVRACNKLTFLIRQKHPDPDPQPWFLLLKKNA